MGGVPALMFIELTDHLRCPSDHDEQFLVLLPDQTENRSIRSGQLGCPVCGRVFLIADGVFDTGDGPPPRAAPTLLTADAIGALAGLHGAGGYLVVAGAPGSLLQEISAQFPGVALVAVNPPPHVVDAGLWSVIRSGRLPIKTRSMRGVVLGAPFGGDPTWIAEASRVVLPGLRVVGEGPNPSEERMNLMASAAGVWVGTPRR